MADTGNVYYCCWKKNEHENYVGWEERRPSLQAIGKTQREMHRSLGNVVGEYYDDHEACLQFDPPLASENGREHLFRDDIVTVGWNAMFWFRPSAEIAFAGGRCKRCGLGLGPRTPVLLTIDAIQEASDGAFSQASNSPPPQGLPAKLKIYSASFIKLLTNDERSQFDTQSVVSNLIGEGIFLELLPKALIPTVAIRGLEARGWQCNVCQQRSLSLSAELGPSVKAISRSDLPSPLPPCFFVAESTHFDLCVSRQRWKELCAQPHSRKMTSKRLAIVDEQDCVRMPQLPTLDEISLLRQQHCVKPNRRPAE